MSKRQESRIARGFTESRCNRRASNRLASSISGYHAACKADQKNGAKAFTMPGANKCW